MEVEKKLLSSHSLICILYTPNPGILWFSSLRTRSVDTDGECLVKEHRLMVPALVIVSLRILSLFFLFGV